jgi:hypothetical protein
MATDTLVRVEEELKTYKVPVTWEMHGVMEVKARSYEEAKEMVYGDAPLPTDGEYVDGSISINEEMFLYFNTPKQVAVKSYTFNHDWYSLLIGDVFHVLEVSEDKLNFIVEHNGERKELRVRDALVLNVA